MEGFTGLRQGENSVSARLHDLLEIQR